MFGAAFWVAPVLFAIAAPASLFFVRYASNRDPMLGVFLFVLFAGFAIWLWVACLREYGKYQQDLQTRLVEVLDNAPDAAWIARPTGSCYLRLGGRKIRIPADRFRDLKEATTVNVVFLPLSLVAVRVEAAHGIKLSP